MSTLFSDDYTLELTDDEAAIVGRPINGDGGAQRLLRRLHALPAPLRADDRLLDRCYHYAYAYDGGGFQDRFRAVVRAALRAGWVPPEHEPPRRSSGGAFGRAR